MKTIAALDPDSARTLAALLAKQGIACEERSGTDEAGVETTELYVARRCARRHRRDFRVRRRAGRLPFWDWPDGLLLLRDLVWWAGRSTAVE
jgi:hypothetical protein